MTTIFPSEISEFMRGASKSVRIFKSGPASQALLAGSLLSKGENVVIVVPSVTEFREMRALLSLFSSRQADDLHRPEWERDWFFLPP